MGLRELLILILILAIVVVVLRGLYVALRSRRGQIKIALEKNIPEYDLDELEMRELPNGGARMVGRSFAEVQRQNSAHAAKANATASGKPSTLRPGARGLKTNLSRSASRTAPTAAAVQSSPEAEETEHRDDPLLIDEGLNAQQGVTPQPRHEDNDDPASYERELVEDETLLFDEEPLVNVGDGNFDEEMLSEPEEMEKPLATEEPSAYKEPSAEEEPLAHKEPSADEEPSAEEEPADAEETSEAVFSFVAVKDIDDTDAFEEQDELDTQDERNGGYQPDAMDDDVYNTDVDDDSTDGDDDSTYDSPNEGLYDSPHDSLAGVSVVDRRPRNDDELDDVLDELLQKSVAPETPAPTVRQAGELPEPVLTWDMMAQEPESELKPEPELESESVHYGNDDPLFDYTAGEDETDEQDRTRDEDLDDSLDADSDDSPGNIETTQNPNTDSQSDPHSVEDDMPDFDDENIADPNPQPDEQDSFAARGNDEIDVLFDDDDRERRIAALEEQQETASKRFMSWAGGAFSRLGSSKTQAGSKEAVAKTEVEPVADDEAERNRKADKKARKKLAKAEKRQAREQAEQNAAAPVDDVEDYFDDDDGVSAVREQARPGAAEGNTSAPLTQSQLDLGDANSDEDAYYNEEEQGEGHEQEPPGYSEVLVINVMARPGTEMHGDDLLPVLMSSGLKFGEMSIFHYHTDKVGGRKNGPVMFSVANALNPGTFDLNRISEFATLGVCFFMTLPNVVNNMVAFEQMLATARKVQGALDAELKDDNRSVMTAQTVEHYRQRIRDFELQELKNARAR